MDRTMDFNGMNGFPPPYMNNEFNSDSVNSKILW